MAKADKSGSGGAFGGASFGSSSFGKPASGSSGAKSPQSSTLSHDSEAAENTFKSKVDSKAAKDVQEEDNPSALDKETGSVASVPIRSSLFGKAILSSNKSAEEKAASGEEPGAGAPATTATLPARDDEPESADEESESEVDDDFALAAKAALPPSDDEAEGS